MYLKKVKIKTYKLVIHFLVPTYYLVCTKYNDILIKSITFYKKRIHV